MTWCWTQLEVGESTSKWLSANSVAITNKIPSIELLCFGKMTKWAYETVVNRKNQLYYANGDDFPKCAIFICSSNFILLRFVLLSNSHSSLLIAFRFSLCEYVFALRMAAVTLLGCITSLSFFNPFFASQDPFFPLPYNLSSKYLLYDPILSNIFACTVNFYVFLHILYSKQLIIIK